MRKATQINVATVNYIHTIIESFVDEERLFTAYDITKQLRHYGYHVMHKDVKAAVRSYGFPHDYCKSHSSIGAFVWHPSHLDVSEYDPNDIDEFVVDATTNTTNAQAHTTTSGSILNKQGRYCVPAKSVREAGFNVGDEIQIDVSVGRIKLSIVANDDALLTAKVDKYMNIRIPARYFTRAFGKIPTHDKLTVAVDGNQIGLFG
jgi:hypothetical protein